MKNDTCHVQIELVKTLRNLKKLDEEDRINFIILDLDELY